jgi:hypothetical protein
MTSIALQPNESLHLVALDRPQLESAHAQMIAWAKARRDKVDVDVDVESTSLDVAARNGWLTTPFTRRLNALARQRTFYDKIIAALEAGFAIVPNFAMNVFAIRTNAAAPRQETRDGRWNRFVQPAQLLAVGEGRYVNPEPLIVTDEQKRTNGQGNEVSTFSQWPHDEFEDVEFPLVLARPELMTSVGEAMARKLFDEIGVAVDAPGRASGGRGDPILLGRLLNPRRSAPALTFFLGWYFDPSRL